MRLQEESASNGQMKISQIFQHKEKLLDYVRFACLHLNILDSSKERER